MRSTPATLSAGVQFQNHDYFASQPVENAKTYHLRQVIYDLGDADAIRVLEAIKPAMGVDSRILIADHLIPCAGDFGQVEVQDIIMLWVGEKERAERHGGIGACRCASGGGPDVGNR